jgi:hypothetical protein
LTAYVSKTAGGTIREGGKVFWGGYSAISPIRKGTCEVAFNPFMPIDAMGTFSCHES